MYCIQCGELWRWLKFRKVQISIQFFINTYSGFFWSPRHTLDPREFIQGHKGEDKGKIDRAKRKSLGQGQQVETCWDRNRNDGPAWLDGKGDTETLFRKKFRKKTLEWTGPQDTIVFRYILPFKEWVIPTLYKLFQKNRKLPHLFNETKLCKLPKSQKDYKKIEL